MINKLILIFLLIVSMACYFILHKNGKSIIESPMSFANLKDRDIVEIKINENTFNVEIVNTAYSTTQGLSGRDEIGQPGMLFIFPTQESRYFWMKDMKFDIDIVWILDEKVVDIHKNVPKPEENTPDNRLVTYSPKQNVDMVLELNAGDADKYNINSGDVVQLVQ